MKSIQSKILLVVISGLLVITAVVSAIAVSMTHEIMHKDADRILQNATQKEAAKINDVLGDVMKSSNVMKHYAVSEAESADALKDVAFREKYLEKAEIMFSEVVLNTSGVEGFYMRIDPELSDGKTGFYKTINDDGSIENMDITDFNKYDKNDEKNLGWYYSVINETDGIWLEPYKYPGVDSELITFAQPVYVNGEFVGVVGIDMNFSYLIKKIDDIRVYEYGYASLMSADGDKRYNNAEISNSDNPQTESTAELKNGMLLVTHADYKDIQKDIHPMLGRIVFAFGIVFLCSIVYTVFVTRKIVGPLKRLTAAADNLSENLDDSDFSGISVQTKDEIGVLSKTLYNTYSKIREYTTYINALAYRDSLTGIKNSLAYTEVIGELNKEIHTGNPKFGVIVADINNLKETNDRYGHDVGNELIIHTAKILMNTFESSAIYRIGGDEFVVLLQGNDYTQYRYLMEKLDEACLNDNIAVCQNNVPVSVARGVAIYDPTIDNIYEDVFSKADHAMYMNKEKMKLVQQNI